MKRADPAANPGREAQLAKVREAAAAVAQTARPPRWADGMRPEVNPTLRALQLAYRGLGPLALGAGAAAAEPVPGEELLLVWRQPGGAVVAAPAEAADLLALKLAVEPRGTRDAAVGELGEPAVEAVLAAAADKGLLLAPRPLIARDASFPRGQIADDSFLVSRGFTLQWHLTQACDLHCRHCYDRRARAALPLADALRVLDDLKAFCRQRRVRGAVSLTGGNPLLHPHLLEIYRAAAERGFGLAVLGNPAPPERIEQLLAIRAPDFFQVSLEGLAAHDDWVRGPGHFARTVQFLRELRRLGIRSMVMLTLTADNVDQVLPLAESLRGLVDDFHFNRLAMVGEGARLRLPGRETYRRFLERYLEAAERNPALGLKDNQINVLRRERGLPPFGGCTGFGCGAAFNFLSLLPDGEAHACRKFPSRLGNAVREGLAAVYDSPAAQRFRAGCAACAGCALRPVCGGCLAVAHGFGLDPLRERDPLCLLGGRRGAAPPAA